MEASRRGKVGTPMALAVNLTALFTGWAITARVEERVRAVAWSVSAKGTPTRAKAWIA
jgi:hypothetical protein